MKKKMIIYFAIILGIFLTEDVKAYNYDYYKTLNVSSLFINFNAKDEYSYSNKSVDKIDLGNNEMYAKCVYVYDNYTISLMQTESYSYMFNLKLSKDSKGNNFGVDKIKVAVGLKPGSHCPEYAYLNKNNSDVYFSSVSDLKLEKPWENNVYEILQYKPLLCKGLNSGELKEDCDKKTKQCNDFYDGKDNNSFIKRIESARLSLEKEQNNFKNNCFTNNGNTPTCNANIFNTYMNDLTKKNEAYVALLKDADTNFLDIECYNAPLILRKEEEKFNTLNKPFKEKLDKINEVINTSEDKEFKEKTAETRKVYIEKIKNNATMDYGFMQSTTYKTCEELIGEKGVVFLNKIFGFIKVLAPIFLIFFSTLDYTKAVLADDKDTLSKMTKRTIFRALATIIIFFIPNIVNILLSFLGDVGAGGSCGIK